MHCSTCDRECSFLAFPDIGSCPFRFLLRKDEEYAYQSMFSWLSGGSAPKATPAATQPSVDEHTSAPSAHQQTTKEPLNLLVIQSDNYHWAEIIGNRTVKDGRPIRVFQTSWQDLKVGPCGSTQRSIPKPAPASPGPVGVAKAIQEGHSATFFPIGDTYSPAKRCDISVTITKQWINGKAVDGRPITFRPDFVLVRNEVTTPNSKSGRNELLGLMYSNVPSVNTLRSIYLFCDKPVVQGALNQVRSTLYAGREYDFPLIPQDFFPTSSGFFYGQQFPAVVKFGTAHAGFGKVKVAHHHDMDDIRGLLPLTVEGYATAEPFVKNSGGDYRIQKIGKHVRAFKRNDVCGAWKTNTGTAILSEVPVTRQFAEWAEAASRMFNINGLGEDTLDILTVDAIIDEEDSPTDPVQQIPPPMGTTKPEATDETPPKKEEKVYILEVNGTSSGLGPDHDKEDNGYIADLVVEKMSKFYC